MIECSRGPAFRSPVSERSRLLVGDAVRLLFPAAGLTLATILMAYAVLL